MPFIDGVNERVEKGVNVRQTKTLTITEGSGDDPTTVRMGGLVNVEDAKADVTNSNSVGNDDGVNSLDVDVGDANEVEVDVADSTTGNDIEITVEAVGV